MKIWIDLSNSPHPLLFAPVARQLEEEGHRVLVTARDHAQTVQLALQRWPDVEVIGLESPGGRAAKLKTIGSRVARLHRWAKSARPDVALSHNSYAQIVAARALGIRTVTAMDFEHQPANHLAFRLANRVLVPDVLPERGLRRQGAGAEKIVRYPGLKEELYIGDFEPDPSILVKLGIERRPRVLAVARTAPTRAIYHQFDNPLFEEALRTVCAQDGVTCVVLARHVEQAAAIASLRLSDCVVPSAAIDSRSLIHSADLVIGAGGTMTREAALMGIPAWTLFAGAPPAVDRWLERRGMLRRLAAAEQLVCVEARPTPPRAVAELRERGTAIGRAFVDTTVASRPDRFAGKRMIAPA